MNLNLDLNRLGQINEADIDEEKERKRIVNYLYQLTEQLRYWQYNLEEENFAPELREDYKAIKNGLSELRVEADEISAMVSGTDGLEAAWTQIQLNLQNISLAAGRIETMTDGTNYATRLINSALNLTPTDLTVAFNDKTAMQLTATAADFSVDTLSVSGDIVGNVVNTSGGTLEYTVTDANAVMSDLQAWVNGLGKFLTASVTINIKAPITGNLNLYGFKTGAGNSACINVNFSDNGRLWGGITISHCDKVVISGKGSLTNFDISPEAAGNGIMASGVRHLRVSNVTVDMTGSSSTASKTSFRTQEGTHSYFSGCCAMGGAYGWYITEESVSCIMNCYGGQGAGSYAFTSKAIIVCYGSIVHVAGNRKPMGSIEVYINSATVNVYSGSTATAGASDNTILPQDPGGSAHTYATIGPQISSDNTYGGTLISTSTSATSTDQSAVVKHTAATDGKVRSGQTKEGYCYGIFYFGTAITGLANKSSITSATVRLTRANHEGGNTANKVHLRYYTTAVSGASSAASETPGTYFGNGNMAVQNIEINLGKSKTVTLTGDALTALKNGTLAGFGVSGAPYMEFEKQGCELNAIW